MDDVTEKDKTPELKEAEPKASLDSNEQSSSVEDKNSLHTIAGEYEVIECIGKGGMGTVYKVKEIESGKILAVKFLQKELAKDNAALKRFEQETESASKLSHPNLVNVYKHGKTESGEAYLVMDFLEGKSLSQTIQDEGTLEQDRTLDIFLQICDGLEHAHDNGVIHRDIKPTNIILTRDSSGAEVAKLVDFGIAKVMNASTRETHDLTQTGEVFGSPHYMSPEQCLGFMLKEQSDIYSLGCTLYETLTGEPPFAGTNPIQLVVKHINDNASGFEKSLKKDKKGKQLETVTLKCMEKEPENRFQKVSTLKTDLNRIKNGKSIPFYDVKTKAKPTLTKRQLLVTFAITIGALCLTAMTSSIYGFQFSSTVMTIIVTVIMLASFSALFAVGIDNLKKILSNNHTAKTWWSMIFCTSGGLAGLLSIPSLVISSSELTTNVPLFIQQAGSICDLAVVFFLVVALSSVFGILLFRKKKKVSALYIVPRQIILSLLIVFLPCLIAPVQVAKVVDNYSNNTYETIPQISKQLSLLEVGLNKDRFYNAYRKIAKIEFDSGNIDKTYEYLKLAEQNEKKDADKATLAKELAEYLIRDNQPKEALKVLNNALDKYIDKEKGFTLSYLLTARAMAYKELSMYDKALIDLETSISSSVGDSRAYDRKALVLCAQGKYAEALKFLNETAKVYYTKDERLILIALIEDKLGLKEKAISDYRKILKNTKWMAKFDPSRYGKESLTRAYALKGLGMTKDYNTIMKKLKLAKADLNDLIDQQSGLIPDWEYEGD